MGVESTTPTPAQRKRVAEAISQKIKMRGGISGGPDFDLADAAIAAMAHPEEPDMVEEVAKAMYDARAGDSLWSGEDDFMQAVYRRDAEAALKTIAAGAVVRYVDYWGLLTATARDAESIAAVLGVTTEQLEQWRQS